MKSETPNSLTLVSAKATPTNLDLALSVTEDDDILTARTIGADVTSELTKRRSSTAWRFPGDAFQMVKLWL
jgi:hypothetical protein